MFGYSDVETQAWMILDHARTHAFAEAIRRVVRPGDVVVEVGAGSGILSVIAARAGARRVYAVEALSVAELAKRVVKDNGVSDVVEVLRGDARDVAFPEPPSVIVSEMLGNFATEEDIVELMNVVRRRCTRDVRVIPRAFEVILAPLADQALADGLARVALVEGVELREARERLVNRPNLTRLRPEILAGPGLGTGLIRLPDAAMPSCFRTQLTVSRSAYVNAVGAWFSADLADGIRLGTGPDDPPTHWSNYRFIIDPPISCRAEDTLTVELEPRLAGGRSLWRWHVETSDEQREGDVLRSSGGSLKDFAGQLGIELKGYARR